MIRPMMALKKVLRALADLSSLPPEVMNVKPARMIITKKMIPKKLSAVRIKLAAISRGSVSDKPK